MAPVGDHVALEDDDDLAYTSSAASQEADEEAKKKLEDGRPAWMRTLHASLAQWMALVPKQAFDQESLPGMRRTVENIKDPLFRFFEREVNAGARLLADVRRDMKEVMLICQGERKPTNHHRQLMAELAKGMIPQAWRRYTIPAGLTVIQWITDFSERIKQLQHVAEASQQGGPAALKNVSVWLGGLFIPEAYITATRQYVAQANSWSLEELYLDIKVLNASQKASLDECSFGVTGLKLLGAMCQNSNQLSLSSTISTDLPLTVIRWIRYDSVKPSETRVTLPVYLNSTRAQLLFTVDFETAGDGRGGHSFYERGVALTSSTLGS